MTRGAGDQYPIVNCGVNTRDLNRFKIDEVMNGRVMLAEVRLDELVVLN